jgi:MFS superfamily sulfate permease-like transporter
MSLKKYFSHDFPSGVVVFLVALPLCLGIALASGAPLFSGVIAGIIGGIVVGTLSKSPLSVSGPAAGLTTIVLAAIGDLGFEAFLMAVFLAGLLQIFLGFIRAGFVGNFFPAAVIKGMLAAIGLILILKQLPHAVGYDADFEGDESFFQSDNQNTFTEIFKSFDYLSPGAIVISILAIIVLVLWNTNYLQRFRFFKVIPGALVAVLLGVFMNIGFKMFFPDFVVSDEHMVSVPVLSSEAKLSSFIIFPDFSSWLNPKVYIAAVTIAIVASLETLLSIEACDKMDPYRRITPLNRELKAQGTANALSGLLGGLPLTSVIVRSSANINSGAKTKASAITHGVILLGSVLLIPTVLKQIPLACLAGILILVGYKLTSPSLYKEMYHKGWSQFLPFVVTVVAVVFTNLLMGVFIGILVAIFFILKTNFKESIILVNEKNNYLLKFTKDVSFLSKGSLRNIFHKIPEDSTVVIDGSAANFIDRDIIDLIEDFVHTSKVKRINVELKNIEQ